MNFRKIYEECQGAGSGCDGGVASFAPENVAGTIDLMKKDEKLEESTIRFENYPSSEEPCCQCGDRGFTAFGPDGKPYCEPCFDEKFTAIYMENIKLKRRRVAR